MNEKSKRLMAEQKKKIFSSLKDHFGLEVYEDEIAEDEEEQLLNLDKYNFFTLEMSNFRPAQDPARSISQDVIIDYYSEKRDDVDEVSIDVISLISAIKGMRFTGTQRERLRVKDMDRYIDRVSFLFRRVIPIECAVRS
ncbi:hypothetical protein [Siminovitchia fortis]|uniref:hypothetical protein n=1 Tax=Siminovitchia fortis TaxID=254758 RepID=UPI0011A30865|nr:hypothetical protein [Siminovitchia fortis]